MTKEEQVLIQIAEEFPEFKTLIESVITQTKDQRQKDLIESSQYNTSEFGPARPKSSGVKIPPPRPFSPNIIDTFANPRRKQPLQFGLMGMPYRSGAPYLGR